MGNIFFLFRTERSILFLRLAMSVLILFITACSAPVKALKPGEPCPVTPSKPASIIDGIGPIAGAYPVYLNLKVDNQIPWHQLDTESLSPYAGRTDKELWAIADDIQGKLRITGKQLDGKGIVLFPNDNSAEWINDSAVRYKEKPMDTLIIDLSSSNGRITRPKPKSYTYFGSSMIFPHPGCYQFTASIDKNTVNVVVEILDK